MKKRSVVIGVIGAGRASAAGLEAAEEVGRLVAEAGAVLVCGGLGGVMEAACRGARRAGGFALGLLPGDDPAAANPYVSLAVPTGLGHARNVLVAQTAQVLIAVEGEYGTLSEMAIGRKLGRPVIALQSWPGLPGVDYVATPRQAVELALQRLPA